MNLASSLIWYYGLNGIGGSNAVPDVGSTTLTQVNSPASAVGVISSCRTFVAASSQRLNGGDVATFEWPGGDWSIFGWYKPSTIGTRQSIVSKTSGSAGQREYMIEVATAGTIQGSFCTDGTTLVNLDSTTVLVADRWYQWALSYKQSLARARLVINGTVEAQSDGISRIWRGTANFSIGSRNSANTFANGAIDECGALSIEPDPRVWRWLYNAGQGRSLADLSSVPTLVTRRRRMSRGIYPALRSAALRGAI